MFLIFHFSNLYFFYFLTSVKYIMLEVLKIKGPISEGIIAKQTENKQ